MLKIYGNAMCATQVNLIYSATYIVHSCKNKYSHYHHATYFSSITGHTRENERNMSKIHLHFDINFLQLYHATTYLTNSWLDSSFSHTCSGVYLQLHGHIGLQILQLQMQQVWMAVALQLQNDGRNGQNFFQYVGFTK